MKNSTILISIVLLVLVVGGFIFMNSNKLNSDTSTIPGDVIAGETQKVVISMKNYNYYPQTITVKAGVPVSISLDSSVSGCFRSFTIPQLGVAENLRTPQNNVEFTPDEKGSYKFQCSMGMGYGTIVVE